MTREITAAFPDLPPMVGYASTATCRTYAELPARKLPGLPDLINRFEELAGPPVIVLQNLDTNGAAANFGDVFCNSFKAFGAVGMVTNGAGRDLAGIDRWISRSFTMASSARTVYAPAGSTHSSASRRLGLVSE